MRDDQSFDRAREIHGLCSPEGWTENVAVIRSRVDLWFSEDRSDRDLAIGICSMCPARAACAEAGAEEEWGVWGGTTPADRGFVNEPLPPIPEADVISLSEYIESPDDSLT